MPTYRFENIETGEIFEKWMYMAEKEPYLKENPHIKPLIPTQLNFGETGEWKDKLNKSHPSWNTILDRAGKMPGANVKRI